MLIDCDIFKRISVQITKKGSKYQFRMVIDTNSQNDPRLKNYGENLARKLSLKVFNNSNVELHACTPRFKTLKIFK